MDTWKFGRSRRSQSIHQPFQKDRPAFQSESSVEQGSEFLIQGLDFLKKSLEARLTSHFNDNIKFQQPGFKFNNDGSLLAEFVLAKQLGLEEFLILMLAIAPHAHPDLFGPLLKYYFPKGGEFTEFGGIKGQNYRGILPTGETILFLLAGSDLHHRFNVLRWLKSGQLTIFRDGNVKIETTSKSDPGLSGQLLLNEESIAAFVLGQKWRPNYSKHFPATLLETDMDWEDLVLNPTTQAELQMIQDWLQYESILRKDQHLGKRIKRGYRALFYGKPGTGKTLTATLLGKRCKRAVFRVDLSMVVSKYVGETEKNLKGVFDMAANRDWILFFDEADALFAKRTNVKSSNDRFANQEVSYLLQRIEDHPGLVILASNFRNNLDQAFLRRFQAVIPFQLPGQAERLQLWKNTLPSSIPMHDENDLTYLAKKFELSGASILNIVHKASVKALSKQSEINQQDLLDGIKEEYAKVGRSI